jgi:hypothetical protein
MESDMKTFLFTSTAALLMSGSLAYAEDPFIPSDNHRTQAQVSDDGYVPPEVVAAQRLESQRRQQHLAASRAVSDDGYVPPEIVAAQRLDTLSWQQRSAASRAVSDVGYVPPEFLAEQRLEALREERRLARRLAALRQARLSFSRPVSDVGYVPPEIDPAPQRHTLRIDE